MRLAIASGFACFMLLVSSATAADYNRHTLTTHRIQLIALPYLHAFHQDGQGSFISIGRHQYRQDLSTGQWRITITSIPQYSSHNSALLTVDNNQTTQPALAFRQKLIIPLPLPAGSLTIQSIQRQPLWLQISCRDTQKQAWHAPSLTPAVTALALAEQKRKSRLAKRMADRAFYFGYDTNKDALK